MTNEELIKELRDSKGWPNLGNAAANRIEYLLAANENMCNLWAKEAVEKQILAGLNEELEATVMRLENEIMEMKHV